MIIYNPLDTFYKSQIGAVKKDDLIKFRVKVNFDSVLLMYKKDGAKEYYPIEMRKYDGYFECETCFKPGLYFYHFLTSSGQYISLGNNLQGNISNEKIDFQLLCYSDKFKVPSWLNGGVIYQIFPDRFFRAEKRKNIDSGKVLHDKWGETPVFMPNEEGIVLNNDFFGGDLKGITKKLPYLASLSTKAIYLNPIFKAYSNHRYDTGDYMQIDSLLGTEEDFKALIDSANEYGIKIILDGVFNHTGADSVYFNKYGNYDSVGAYQDKNSKYYSWFSFAKYPDIYDSWWGIETLPAVNENNSDFIDYITGKNGVIEYYTKLGVNGWRLDVVDELPNDFVKKIRRAVKRINKNAILIGEVWEDASNKIAYDERKEYFQGLQLDSVMNYPLKDAIINYVLSGDTRLINQTILEQIDHYPNQCLHALMNILSTHDTFRLISAFSNKNVYGKSKLQLSNMQLNKDEYLDAKKRVKMASLLQYTLYGVPSLYYGDEIGMQGYTDPLNRGCFTWDNIDDELYCWYKTLGKIRSEYSAFKQGETKILFACSGVLVFKRYDCDCEVLVVVNNSLESINISFDGVLTNVFDKKTYKNMITLNSKDYALLVNNK